MAKNISITFLIYILLSCFPKNLGSSCIIEIADTQLGVRELTGKNDGIEVEQYLKSTGLKKGNPYCSAYVHWILSICDIPNTVTAYSPTAFNKKNIVFYKLKFKKEPQPGDVFCLYSITKGRIAHTGFLRERINSKFYKTNEANTNNIGSFDGDGVYEKIRSFNSTYCISRW